MKTSQDQINTDVDHQKTIRPSTVVEVSRSFRAPIEHVWAAWSQPDLMKQWWGPEQFSSPKVEIDFQEGGRFLLGMKSPEGEVNWSVGTITSIVPNQKIVLSESFGNERGEIISPKEAGMANWPGDYHGFITVEFRKTSDQQTQMTIHHTGIPAALHDECVRGWQSSLNKMQRLVERQ